MHMDYTNPIKPSLLRMLRPLIKILISNNVPYQELNELIKESYVEVAENDFRLPNKKQSYSRIGLLTGIKRKEVQKILSEIESKPNKPFRQNSALSVVGAWTNDSKYKGKTLPLEGDISFTSLVVKHSGDIPVRAVLDELLRVKTVERDESNHIRLLSESYVPEDQMTDKFGMISESVRDLLGTGEFNLKHSSPEDRLQLFVKYQGLSKESVDAFKQLSDKKSYELLKEYDAWLAGQASENNNGKEVHQVGVGIYYFEEKQLEE